MFFFFHYDCFNNMDALSCLPLPTLGYLWKEGSSSQWGLKETHFIQPCAFQLAKYFKCYFEILSLLSPQILFSQTLRQYQLAASGHAGQCWRSSRSGRYGQSIQARRGQVVGNFGCVPHEALLGREPVVPSLPTHAAQPGRPVRSWRGGTETLREMEFAPPPSTSLGTLISVLILNAGHQLSLSVAG